MANDEEKGFYVNNRIISMVIGLFSLLTILVTGVTMWNNLTFRVDQQEKRIAEILSIVGKLSDKMDSLNEKVIGLTVTITNNKGRDSQ
jgi:hypothetical protein